MSAKDAPSTQQFGPVLRRRAGRPLTTIVLLALVLTLANEVQADPVFGEIFELRQPDGSTIQVRIWGDEFCRTMESLDSYTLVRDPQSRILCYGELSADGNELVSTGISASRKVPSHLRLLPRLRINKEAARVQVKAARDKFVGRGTGPLSAKAMTDVGRPRTGQIRGLCLPVDFSDEPGVITPSEVRDFCNKIGYDNNGNAGSIRDYFSDVSNGALDYTNYVPAAYYRARNKKTYYEEEINGRPIRARDLVTEALEWLDSQGFDFSQYDLDNDGFIDAVNCLYAGTRGDNGLWPHRWGGIDFTSSDGISADTYQITDMTNTLTIRTFCHENGHLLCDWPDLYDRDRTAAGYDSKGVGHYCLMGGGGRYENPLQPCAYLKASAGWATIIDLHSPQVGLPITAESNTFYRFVHPKRTTEFFLISNRQQSGRDKYLPDSGLAIWHIDEKGNNDNQQMTPKSHYQVTLVQADGRWDLENNRDSGDWNDLFDAGSVDQCTPFTDPSTNWWAGDASALGITNISGSDSTMKFDFGICPTPPHAVSRALIVAPSERMRIPLGVLDDSLPGVLGEPICLITSLPTHGVLEDPEAGPITQVGTALAYAENQVVYTPSDGYHGTDSFSFIATDGGVLPDGGESNEATVSIQVSSPIYVDDNAQNDPGPQDPRISDPAEDGSLEHPFDSIQEAVDHASSSEIVAILPGRYTGQGNRGIDYRGKSIRVSGWGDLEACIVDCRNADRAFYFHSGEGEDTVLENLTITNGKATDFGGGICCVNGSNPTITNCLLSGNSAQRGGGMANSKCSPTVMNCSFSDNSAQWGAGIYNNDTSNPVLAGCTFSGNEALNGCGGGIYSRYSSPTVANCTFTENWASSSGGAMQNIEGYPEIRDCTLKENSAEWGGGIFNEASNPTLVGCVLSGNEAFDGCGGGVHSQNGSNLTVANCTFTENWASSSGGAMQNTEGYPEIRDCTFEANSARYGGGMGNSRSNAEIEGCTFARNSASTGGAGLRDDYCDSIVTGCTFVNNSAAWGAGVYNWGGNQVLINCNVVANEADSNGGGMRAKDNGITTVINCIIWDNTGGQITLSSDSDAIVSYSDIQGGWAGESNIDADPLFADPADGDYHLRSQAGRWDPTTQEWVIDAVSSPCIDAGYPRDSFGEETEPHGGRVNMGTFGGTKEASKSQ